MATQWYLKTTSEILGPLSFEELAVLVHAGALTEEDQVRLGDTASWQRAGSVKGLFHAPEPAKNKDWSNAVKSALVSVDARHKGAQVRGPSSRPHSSGGDRWGDASIVSRLLSGVGAFISGIFSFLFDLVMLVCERIWRSRMMRLICLGAGGLLVLFSAYACIPAHWFTTTSAAYAAITSLDQKINDLRSREASEAEWTAFADSSQQELDRLVPILNQRAGGDQAARELVWAARDYLPKIIQARNEPTADEEYERLLANHLSKAKLRLATPGGDSGSFDMTMAGIVVVDVVVLLAFGWFLLKR